MNTGLAEKNLQQPQLKSGNKESWKSSCFWLAAFEKSLGEEVGREDDGHRH